MIVSVLALAVVCSALAFLLMFALVAEIGPMRMTTITYVNPAVAIVAGALVLGEKDHLGHHRRFALVLGGSYLVTKRRRDRQALLAERICQPIPGRPPRAVVDAETHAGAEAARP